MTRNRIHVNEAAEIALYFDRNRETLDGKMTAAEPTRIASSMTKRKMHSDTVSKIARGCKIKIKACGEQNGQLDSEATKILAAVVQEQGKLSNSFNSLVHGLGNEILELRKQFKQIEESWNSQVRRVAELEEKVKTLEDLV